MATGATIKTNTTYDSAFWVKWAVQGQSVAGNKTTVSWSCGFTPGHKFYDNAVKMSAVTIGGTQVYAGGTYSGITDYKERTFASGTLDLAHNADGSRTFTVGAFSGQVYKDGSFLAAKAGAKSFELPTIPRATVPEIGAVTIGEGATIRLPRASTGFTHTLSYQFGDASGTIASKVGSSYTWAVPEALAVQIPNAKSGTGTLTCKTYHGSTLIGSESVTFTATVPGSMKPGFTDNRWAVVNYDNSGTKASGIAAWVQGYSRAKAAFFADRITCRHGASIKGYSITYLGKTVTQSPYRTEPITATSATIRCTVTDSRGLSAYKDITVTLRSYAPPALVGADLFRSDAACKAADSGTHIAGIATAKCSSLGGLNSVSLKGYWKSVGGSYGSGVTLTSGQAGLVTGSTEISADKSYMAKLVATDSLGNTATYEESIPTEKVAFHLKAGGLGAAFGKAAEADRTLELAEDWQMKVGGMLLPAYIRRCLYPSLTQTQKNQLKALMDSYVEKRYTFGYLGANTRNDYAAASTLTFQDTKGNTKIKVNCETFAQIIWMGRKASDYTVTGYSPTIHTDSDFKWGYYFKFALRQARGLQYAPDAEDPDKVLWPGFVRPYTDSYKGSYSLNSHYDKDVTSDPQRQWPESFAVAGDMAEELARMGCEIPFSELQVGDMLFYRAPSLTDGASDEFQRKQYRHISHAALCYGFDSSGFPILCESTSSWNDAIMLTGLGADTEALLPEDHSADRWVWTRARAADQALRLVMVARHPAAFGAGGNVPQTITAI